LKRGSVVIAATGGGYGGKLRPYVVVQAEEFTPPIVTLIGFSTPDNRPIGLRPRFTPTKENGLDRMSEVMIDIPVVIKREQVRQTIGRLSDTEMSEVDAALLIVLGLAAR
jgi:mRNA interferase MazF